MKSIKNSVVRTKFSQKLRKTLVSMAEDSLKAGERKYIKTDVLDSMKSSI